ncbi:hypothetical protein SAMN02745947_03627 [Rhodococcus rhodochrous J3]|uniref:Uncharacterized protein n=1 Tax=Rhodococcus rhodochrous J3 TaxID=903528 RepID=A0ABY1MDX1_RHORH|nr:hypothetical protein L612_000700001570 [Rhodococcus rhodochrous J38]SMG49559.1 hypothetical protein SAMN02745947_03627 [Rhodococcus rhodochrous J3]
MAGPGGGTNRAPGISGTYRTVCADATVSRTPCPSVTGQSIRSSPVGTSIRIASHSIDQKPSDSANPPFTDSASARVVFHGIARSPAVSAVRPRTLRDIGSMNGLRVLLSRRAVVMSAPWKIRSGGNPSPEGDRATTERARPRTASSIASRPPSELPRTCTRSSPWASSSASRVSVRAPTVGRPLCFGDEPWPGRSTFSTSKCSARRGTRVEKSSIVAPMPCRRSRGSPDPVRR